MLTTRIYAGRKINWLLMVPPVLFAAIDIAENLTPSALAEGLEVMASALTLTITKTVLFVPSIASALLALLTRPRAAAELKQ